MSAAELALFLGPPALIAAGCALLWIHGWIRQQDGWRSRPLSRATVIAGWAMLLVGVFGAVTVAANVFFLIGWLVTAAVLAGALHRYYDGERQSLVWVLTAAASRGIPLESAARSFARDRDNRIGRRAERLADYLEAGLPLGLALARSGHPLPDAAVLAAELGQQTGELGPSLQQVVAQTDEFERSLRSGMEKFFYLCFLLLFVLGALTFMLVKIAPVIRQIIDDFGMEVPYVSQWGIAAAHTLTYAWPLVLLVLLLLLAGMLQYVGVSARWIPGLGRLWRSVDSALVMRWLAVAVRRKRPLSDMLRLLAGYFPRRSVRAKLDRALDRIDGGANWCSALQRVGAIRASDAAVLQAAERVGNLPWALEEMADAGIRRSALRLRACISIAFPLMILAFGAAFLLIALGTMAPLISLIQGLT